MSVDKMTVGKMLRVLHFAFRIIEKERKNQGEYSNGATTLSIITLSIVMLDTESCCADCHSAECCSAS
jgi:hypothetical protein